MGDTTTPITPEQSRAARGLLNWSQDELASAADRGRNTVRHFEAGRQVPSDDTLAALKKALEKAGVEFIPGNGKGAGVRIGRGSEKHHSSADTIPVMKARKRPKATKGRAK